jgi:hypothetical protein
MSRFLQCMAASRPRALTGMCHHSAGSINPRESTAVKSVDLLGFLKKMKALGLRRSAADKDTSPGTS